MKFVSLENLNSLVIKVKFDVLDDKQRRVLRQKIRKHSLVLHTPRASLSFRLVQLLPKPFEAVRSTAEVTPPLPRRDGGA